MKKLLLGLTLLVSMSSFAATIGDGTYVLTSFYCKGQPIQAEVKKDMLVRFESSIYAMKIKGKNIVLSTVDECGATRSMYSINSKNSSKMKFLDQAIATFPGACPNINRMKMDYDLFIELKTDSRIEIVHSGLRFQDEVCSEQLVFVFEK